MWGISKGKETRPSSDGVPEGFGYRAPLTDRVDQNSTDPERVIARLEAQLNSQDNILDSALRLHLETQLEYAKRELERGNRKKVVLINTW